MITMSASSAALFTAVASSALVSTSMRSIPSPAGRVTFAAMSVTDAPRSRAASANAKPCVPVERLPRNLTASIGS
jgi:hypothetical protein